MYMLKKIVIISYATYPGTTPRNLRTDELAKELARQGHDVTLYVLKGNYNYDEYEKETRIKVNSLGKTYFFNFDHNNGATLSFFMKAIRRLVGRFFEFPYIGLAINAYQALKKEKNIDLLITIAVPHPLHWGAALFRTKHRSDLKHTTWIADCGDPYMGNAFHKKPFYFKYVEKWFCNQVDFISIPLEEARVAYYPEFHEKIKVIPQGFNFEGIKISKNYTKNLVPTFIYAGTFYNKLRDPRPFLNFLISLKIDFKFIVYTNTPEILKGYSEIAGYKLQILEYIPRKELIFEMSKVDFLVNLSNPSKIQSPSKLIDYALSNRPILNISSVEEIDSSTIKNFLCGKYDSAFDFSNLDQYNIKNVANEFLELSRE